jgi:RNA polymerase sigma-70 factor (ECF subfamily)
MTTSNGDSCVSIPASANGGEMACALDPGTFAEAELARSLAGDVDAAFESFVIAYRQGTVNFVARMLGDNARAEDIAQDVFVRAYRALHSYSPQRRSELRLRSWTYAIAHNLTRNAIRDSPRTDSLEYDDGHERGAATVDPGPGPELLAARQETWHEIQTAIDRLSPRIRAAYVMRYLHELSYEEIARALEQPIGTVKASAHRAALAVRNELEQEHV